MSTKQDDLYAARRKLVMRHARAIAKKDKKLVDALVLTDVHDVRYCCGMHEGVNALVMDGKWSLVVTSPMFRDLAPKEAHVDEILVWERGQKADEEMKKALRGRGFKKLGVQADKLSLQRYRGLAEHLGEKKLVELSGLVAEARSVKDKGELRLTRKAIKIAEESFQALTAKGAKALIGRSEKDIAAELEYLMRNLGADKQGFPMGMIVASGPNSASCHHMPTDRKCKSGEIILFDWGSEIDGYRSDITRVVYLKSVPKRMEAIHPVVEAALHASTKALKHGVSPKSVDAAARDLIEAAGYGDIRHGVGHGMGLEIHEPPFLGRTPGRMKAGQVVTIEPGIYFDGVGGIRLEDDVLVTAKGRTVLTSLPTGLKESVLR